MASRSQIWKIVLVFLLLVFTGNFVYAEEGEAVYENRGYFINLDKSTIAKGYTVSAFEDSLKLSLTPGILSDSTGVDITEINEEMEMPWQLDKLSKIYQFEFRNKTAYDNHRPFYLQFSYEAINNNFKQVYFFDKNYGGWRPLPTKDYPGEKFVRSLIHLPFARLVVLGNPDILTVGQASWYSFKGGDFAASPDFPKGSKLRVYNSSDLRYADVIINDFGPDRNLHPERAIDLDKVAFRKIAPLGAGVVDVIIEPIFIAPDNFGQVLGEAEGGAEPIISAKSAVVYNEQKGEIIWGKNATTTLPLASLTKLVAVKVYLDTRPSLNEVVTYQLKDEEYNYEYCNKWESAKINLTEGEKLSVEDLIYSALVGSANNAIETLVRVSGLGRSDFIKKMNDSVLGWGATATHFVEPTGLSPENVSSALDYAIITKEVFTHPIIVKASTMPAYSFSTINTEKKHRIKNTNQIIFRNKFEIGGSKTGYLDEAGYCLMTRVKIGRDYLIVVTMGAGSRDISFVETEELIKYGIRKIEPGS